MKDLQLKLARFEAFNQLHQERIRQLCQQNGQSAPRFKGDYLPGFSVLPATNQYHVDIWDMHPSMTKRHEGLTELLERTASSKDQGETPNGRMYRLTQIVPVADLTKPWSAREHDGKMSS